MKYVVTVKDTDDVFLCDEDKTVLEGMVRLGRRGIPAGCRGGGCGVCKVQVTQGEYEREVMSRQHVSEEDIDNGRVLACRIRPRSDLVVEVIGRMTKVWKRDPSA